MRTIIGEGGDDDVAGDLGGTLISNEQSLILVDFKKVIMSTLVCWECEKNVLGKTSRVWVWVRGGWKRGGGLEDNVPALDTL